jgi:3-isopropylmalate dehydrogenase
MADVASDAEGQSMKDIYKIAVVHGDGIGPEVGNAALKVLATAFEGTGPLLFQEYPAGAQHFKETGVSLPKETFNACRAADAILHGAAGIPGVIHPDGTEAGLDFTLTLRSQLDLYANLRPIRLLPGVQSPLRDAKGGDIDYVIVRENSEGLYAARGAGTLLRDEVAIDTLVQTRKGVERIVRFAFDLARTRNGAPADGRKRVTCCDKANVLRSFAFFRSVFDLVASEYPDIEAEHVLVDAMTVHLIKRPAHFDVIVCENMFGDILSDLGAATVGEWVWLPPPNLAKRMASFRHPTDQRRTSLARELQTHMALSLRRHRC